MKYLYGMIWFSAYETNTLDDATNPEAWARESLEILQETIVSPSLVHRDFENEIQEYGDTVNARMPAKFLMKRKTDQDDVVPQNADMVKIPVVLNQHCYASFFLRDGQLSRAFPDLVKEFLVPAVMSIGTGIDQIVLGQTYQFLGNSSGRLGKASASTIKSYLLDARRVANNNKMPRQGRNMIWTSEMETQALNVELFTDAASAGDSGLAQREGVLGRKFGFDNFMCQNASEVAVGNTVVKGAINNSGGHAAGATSITVDGLSAAIANGTWFTVDGDDRPLRVTGTTGGSSPTAITFTPALTAAVADNAVVTLYSPGAVNLGSGYAAGYIKEIVVDGFSVAPQVGQGVSFGTASHVYSIIEASTTSITLDRPLEAAIADNAIVALLPAGSYSFGFDRGALALVTRPLAMPVGGNVMAYVANAYDMSIRVVMTYDGRGQGTLVTLDLLAGVKTLNTDRGLVMMG